MSHDVRLINANALMDAMRDEEFQTFVPLDEIDSVIDKAPTIDAVPVVRCRECKNRGHLVKCPLCWNEWHDEDERFTGYYEQHDETKDEGYCWCGEKMDGGAEG